MLLHDLEKRLKRRKKMIKNYTPASYETVTEYDLVFDDGYHNGFCFPCDKDGNLLSGVPQVAIQNYRRCLETPERFIRYNKVIKTERRVRNNARGTCHCGNSVELYNMYLGACQCEKCGQWYNVFGQMLVPPEHWEDDCTSDDYYGD